MNLEKTYHSVDTLINSHDDFWNRRLKRPIISGKHSLTNKLKQIPLLHDNFRGKEGLVLKPEMLSSRVYQNGPLDLEDSDIPCLSSPIFNTVIPYPRIPWLPGIAGSQLIISWKAQTVWVKETMDGEWFKKKDLGFRPQEAWLCKLLDFVLYMVNTYQSEAVPTMDMISRGVGDLMVNLMGAEVAYTALYDHPDELKELLSRITDIHIEWAKKQLEIIPRVKEGYCNQYGLFAPGTITRFQEDFAGLLSRNQFYEFLMPCENRIADAFDYQVLHTHSGVPRLAEWAMDIEGLRAVEVTLDPNGPPLEQLIPLWNKIMERLALIISGKMSTEKIEMITSELSPGGLFLDVAIDDEYQKGTGWFDDGAGKKRT